MNKLLSFTIFLFIITSTYLYVHESTHKVIFQNYGCEDIKQELFKVTAICNTNTDVEALNNMNEIIGYNVSLPLYIIIILLYINLKGD